MSHNELLNRLRRANIRLTAVGGQLRYSAPQGVVTAELLKELVDHKSFLLDALKHNERSHFKAGRTLARVHRDLNDAVDLSYAQERLWLDANMSDDSATYNVPVAVRVHGPLDVKALGQSLNRVIERHEILRTVFRWDGSRPVQIVKPPWQLHIEQLHHFRGAFSECEPSIRTWMGKEAHIPLDLENGPLLRVKVAHLSPEEFIILLVIHHIVSDAWSLGVLLREVNAFYCDYCFGTASSLPELPIQYCDYAIWQRRWMDGPLLERHLAYWRRLLAGESKLRRLVADASGGIPRGGILTTYWDQALSHRLKNLAKREDTTPFVIVATALAIALCKEHRSLDVTIGVDIANRHDLELENLIGFFVNIITLRFRLQPNVDFSTLTSISKKMILEASSHGEVPFERVVQELHPDRKAGATPLFQVLLVMQNTPPIQMRLGESELSPIPVESETTRFELAIVVREHLDRTSVEWNYRIDLFRVGTLERLAGTLQKTLSQVLDNPETPLSHLLYSVDAPDNSPGRPRFSPRSLREARRSPSRFGAGVE